jgi:hypothetical protein
MSVKIFIPMITGRILPVFGGLKCWEIQSLVVDLKCPLCRRSSHFLFLFGVALYSRQKDGEFGLNPATRYQGYHSLPQGLFFRKSPMELGS